MQNFDQKARDHLLYLGVDKSMMLNWIIVKQGGLDPIWTWTGSSSRLL